MSDTERRDEKGSGMARTNYLNFGSAIVGEQRRRDPSGPAVTYRGGEAITNEQLDRAVDRRARALQQAGVGRGEVVATLLQSTLAITEVYFAQSKVGSVLAALNPYWPEATLVGVLSRIRPTTFLYDAAFDDVVESIRPHSTGIERWIRVGGAAEGAIDLDALASVASDAPFDAVAGGDDPLALFFTSGTTGLPKAVEYSHASALTVAQKLWLDVPAGQDCAIGTGPIIWGVGFIAVAAPALAAGARLVLEDDFAPDQFLVTVPREKITHISVTPSFFSQLLGNDAHVGVDLTSLRVALLGGEPLLPSLQRRIVERFPRLQLYGYYGQTEAPYSVIGRRDDGLLPEGAVGFARTGGSVRVVDSRGTRVTDEPGEVQLSGPHVTSGYYNQPDKTAEALDDGWFDTGDLGTIDRLGRLTVLGRRTDAIERAGQFVLPARIEDAASSVSGVHEAAAVGVKEPGGDDRILLVVQADSNDSEIRTRIREALAADLPDWAQPDAIFTAAELPHANDGSGGRGKLLRREVLAQWGHLTERLSTR
ncbi:AMP-binding protein [Rhodococcus sp. 077-4]|uniref:class I adenylate-forming enzyme family protein n=1 Tax=Rhodococcus sp. 077-4 TaxID=2789271 RepID=UPI0039F5FC29